MFETSRHTVLAVLVGLAILSAVAAPGLIVSNAAAQTTQGNETSTIPSGNETSTTTAPAGNETSAGTTTITLTPNSGGAGTNVTIAGTGFSPGQTFRFTFDNGYLLTGNMIQFATGEFNTTALVPDNATSGDHEVTVAGSMGENATATFSVVEGPANTTSSSSAAAGAPSGNETSIPSPGNETATTPGNATSLPPPNPGIGIATLVLTPTSVSTGSELNIAGTGFSNDQNVTLAIDDNTVDTNSTITTDANGAFTVAVTIPENVTAGDHQVTATDGSGVKASATLSVTAAASTNMPPSPPP
jgi:uncharacterized membrane protein